MKKIKRVTIIVETREVLIVRGELLRKIITPGINLNPIRNRGFHNQSHKGEMLMKLRKIFATLTIAIVLIAMPAVGRAQSNPKGNLEGAWNAILVADEGGFQEMERYTFSAGRSVNEGSLIFSNEVDAVPPCGTDQGVWVRSGNRQFTLTHGAFCVDLSNGSPAFRIKFREVITINSKDDQFTGRGIFEVFDTSGGLLFSANYTVHGTRMQAEGLTLNAPASASQIGNQASQEASPWRRWMKNLLQ